ncbi:MAG: OmpH family outer membrane protein [Bacteroidales bacterium]|nr:OmpH family outer membrane protein [Bacteroidales bacterium]
MKKVFLILIITGLVATGYSQQKVKFGHLNSNDLLDAMPDKAQAQKTLQDYSKQLEDQLVAMQEELEKKYNEYLEKKDTFTDLIKKNKEEELTSLQQRIQTFQANAQQDLQKKEQELLKPIIDKAKKAIEDVSKENGYTYIFDTGTGSLLYYPKDADDILPLVKKKLGIK